MNVLQPDNPYYWRYDLAEPYHSIDHIIYLIANDEVLTLIAAQPEVGWFDDYRDIGRGYRLELLPFADPVETWCKWDDLIKAFIQTRQRESVWDAAINELDGLV